MATMYRLSKTVRTTDAGLADRRERRPRDSAGTAPQNSSIWSARHEKRSSSTSPVVAMIEPFHHEYTSQENAIGEKLCGTQLHVTRDEQKSDFYRSELAGIKQVYRNSMNDDRDESLDDASKNIESSHSLHLETGTTGLSSEQTSPGSMCSTDSGIGSTQSIAELWTKESTHPPQTHDLQSQQRSVGSNQIPTQVHSSVTENLDPLLGTSAVLLKRFIKRNLRINSEDSNSSDDSLEPSADHGTHQGRAVHTPEPEPQYRVDVTAQDRIWQKDSGEEYVIASPLRMSESSNNQKLWNARDIDLPSDTESESSQDTIILMTSNECSQNGEGQLKFINDRELTSTLAICGGLSPIDKGDIVDDGTERVPDFHQHLGTKEGDYSVLIHHHTTPSDKPSFVSAEKNVESVRKRVTFSETPVLEKSSPAKDFLDLHEGLRKLSTSVPKSDKSLKTNYGYLSRNRVPSFRKMNQTFRRPVMKANRNKPSALEEQLRALSIAESEAETSTENDVDSYQNEMKAVPKPIDSQPKKRVHFNDIVMKRIVCPPDNDNFTVHNNTAIALNERHMDINSKQSYMESVTLNYKIDKLNANRHSLNSITHSTQSNSVVSNNAAPRFTSIGNDIVNRQMQGSDTRPVLKYKLSRTPSIDRKHVRNERHISQPSNPPELQEQSGYTGTSKNDHITPTAHTDANVSSINVNPETDIRRQYNKNDADNYKGVLGASFRIPFFKDNMILYSAGNNGGKGRTHLGETHQVSTQSPDLENEPIYDELSSFVDRDRVRIDKLRRRYRPSDNYGLHSPQTLTSTENVDSENMIQPSGNNSSQVAVLRGRDVPRLRPHSDIVVNTNEKDIRRNINSADLSRGSIRNKNRQPLANSGDNSKAVYGTTADLFRMMVEERRRGSQTSASNTGSKLVRRHSAHVHSTRTTPVTSAGNRRDIASFVPSSKNNHQ